jgi:antitoxin component of RelBE/YafQ-DinJ toxin-antitoxin module
MLLTEVVKGFFSKKDETPLSSEVPTDNILMDMSDDDFQNTGSFFDDNDGYFFTQSKRMDNILKQREKITKYRQMAMNPEVSDAIEEIVNEIIFTYDDKIPLKLFSNEENEKIVDALEKSFDKIVGLSNIRRNLFQIVKQSYIDGKLIFHCGYDKKSTKAGIRSIKLIDPCMFYFDEKSKTYKYASEDRTFRSEDEYSPEEIVIENFGLFDGPLNLSYLEYAIKPANMLKTLEDLLIPLRFSRSISRRVFNVDIATLPTKRGAEVMREHQAKFKYKKFYNNETGEVSNQQHITSMVEDYWFANRSGGKGTTVDVLDESGNLGELDDILYFARKLYRALKIPSNRISIDPDGDKDFSYDETRVTKEDLKFFMFVSRLRQVYSTAFKELLKRDIISTGVLSEKDWEDRENDIEIKFANENKFIEKMNLAAFMEKLEIFMSAKDEAGRVYSYQKLMKDIFRMSEDEIEEQLKEIEKESKNPLFANFYKAEEDGF